MPADLSDLVRVAPPGAAEISRPNWDEAFAALGHELPSDYVHTIDRYGAGRFDEYLWILAPGCEKPSYDLILAAEERAESLEMLWKSGEPKPEELTDPDNRLIPWASTDNGEFVYWLARSGKSPDEWTVMVNEARGDEWEHHDMGCLEFIVSTLSLFQPHTDAW
ncbi:SMI1/KNR4 family protein [Streptomyces boninensis]|uniref:SMI1/KNR4 family protein n=1 Tax=Streptomyces boninensis TaxID=2039455 RepID=UPI003B2250F5